MTREEAKIHLKNLKSDAELYDGKIFKLHLADTEIEALDMAIKALEQEPTKDEVILTKEEYGKLVSSEYDNGYAKGYREALEQESIIDKIRAEIINISDGRLSISVSYIIRIIDKYKAESKK